MPLSGARLSAALSARHPSEYPAARSLPKFGSAPGPRKGPPASPLRFDPGTPFLDQHITDVDGEARCRVVSGSERAAGRTARPEPIREGDRPIIGRVESTCEMVVVTTGVTEC